MARAAANTGSLFSRLRDSSASLDRLSSFRVFYVAIFAFVLLYVFSVQGVERLLYRHFQAVVEEAAAVDPAAGSVAAQIQRQVHQAVGESAWVRIGDVRATVLVLGADGSFITAGGRVPPPPLPITPGEAAQEAERLLPVSVSLALSVPHNALLANAILVVYGAALVTGLFFYNLALARREAARISNAVAARDAAAERTRGIDRELAGVRERLMTLVPAEHEHAEEIRTLQAERETLQQKLAALAHREEELRGRAAQAVELDQERQALEDLLEEAERDLNHKDDEIQQLQRRLKRASKEAGEAVRSREFDVLARRLRMLYKNVEIDDRAIQDIVALRDEAMKLRAEEGIQRLSSEAENAAIRRKVGGLPPHLSIFELGFAGKGRVYYSRGRQRRFRILTVGAKNTQKTDLEYLSRLARSDM